MRVRRDAFDVRVRVRLDVDLATGDVFEPMRPLTESFTGATGEFEDWSCRIEFAEVGLELCVIEIGVRQ